MNQMTWLAIAHNFFQLTILFAPLALWSRRSTQELRGLTVDDFVWWLGTIKTSAIITLWVGVFNPAAFFFVFAALIFLASRLRQGLLRQGQFDLKNNFGSILIAAILLSVTIISYETFIDTPKAADALAYHLPMAAQWVKTQSMFAQDSRVWFYPGGYELLTSVFFLITRNDLLWFVPDILALTLLSVSTYQVLSVLGVAGTASGLFVAALLLTPVVSRTIGVGDNDLWVAALAMAVVGAFLRSMVCEESYARASGMICLGALACAKYSALPFILLAPLYIAFSRINLLKRLGSLETVALSLATLLAISFPIRNFLITGNPLYPTGIGEIFPWGDTSHLVSILNKITPEQLASTALIRHSFEAWQIFLSRTLEKAAILPLVVAIAFACNLVRVSDFRVKTNDLFVLVAAMLAFFIFITQPLVVENVPGTRNQISGGWSLRFGLPWIVLLSTLIFAKIPKGFSLYAGLLLISFAVYSNKLFAHGICILFFSAILFFARKYVVLKAWFFLSLLPIILTILIINNEEKRPYQASDSYTFSGKTEIARLLQRSECSHVIVLSTALRAYPLMGLNFKHRIVSVGMSLPAEKFVANAVLNDANMVIASIENGDANSPTFGKFPPETDRLLSLLGQEWSLIYEDGLVMAFAKTSITPECWKSFVKRTVDETGS